MSIRPILNWPDPRLATPCAPVGEITAEVRTLAADLLQTMYAAPGRGLAAPQVGVLTRLFVMDVAWKDAARDPQAFVDPEILDASSELSVYEEGCLSIPGVTAKVSRPVWVEMAWRDLTGRSHRQRFEGFAATCAQHELDHLNGTVTLDRLSEAGRAEVLAAYQESAT